MHEVIDGGGGGGHDVASLSADRLRCHNEKDRRRDPPLPSSLARTNRVSTRLMRTNAAPYPTEIALADGWNTCS